MVKAGLTPMKAIQAATINAAKLLGQEKNLGQIKVGYLGDLIAIDENPLDNIAAMESNKIVIKNGVKEY